VVSDVNGSQLPEGSETSLKRRVRFYLTREMFYVSLLAFALVAGLSMAAIPSLRHRLTARVVTLRAAIVGEKKPLSAQVGQVQEPLPPEFQRPAAPAAPRPMQLAPLDRIFTAEKGPAIPHSSSSKSHGVLSKSSIIHTPQEVARSEAPEEKDRTAQDAEGGQSGSAAAALTAEIKYQKGQMEQQAYELLLKSIPTVAGLVQGKDPSLHFKSWDAASREDDTYWVRLKFQSNGNPDEDYIWQVKIQANQVTPLSYNARSIS
jgi:hypothetical protein